MKQKRKNEETPKNKVSSVSCGFIFFLLFTALFCGVPILGLADWSDCFMAPCFPKWDDMYDVLDYYNLELPYSATNVQYSNNKSLVKLTFDVPPRDVEIFTSGSCDAELYAGYNPMEAIPQFSSEHRTILIKSHEYAFYSYSPNTPETTLGKLCPWNEGIAVDTSNPNLYYVRFERFDPICKYNCHTTRLFLRPITDSPFAVIGLSKRDSRLVLYFDELCFDTDYYQSFTPPFELDIPEYTLVNISIDDVFEFPTGIVTSQRRLVNEYVPNQNGGYDKRSRFWDFCVKRDWETGKHTVNVEMIFPDESVANHSFDFYVE